MSFCIFEFELYFVVNLLNLNFTFFAGKWASKPLPWTSFYYKCGCGKHFSFIQKQWNVSPSIREFFPLLEGKHFPFSRKNTCFPLWTRNFSQLLHEYLIQDYTTLPTTSQNKSRFIHSGCTIFLGHPPHSQVQWNKQTIIFGILNKTKIGGEM